MGELRRPVALTPLAFLVPGPLDQLTGGYLFGRRVVEGLRALGRTVTVAELAGRFPDADDVARAAAARTLGSLPTGSAAVIDGLALPGFTDCLAREAQRLRLIGFIHHPLSLETGLSAAEVHRYAAIEARLWPLLQGILCPSAHTANAVIAAGVAAHRVVVTMPGTDKARDYHRAKETRSTASACGRHRNAAQGTSAAHRGAGGSARIRLAAHVHRQPRAGPCHRRSAAPARSRRKTSATGLHWSENVRRSF